MPDPAEFMMESPEKQGPIPGEVRAELHVDENHMEATLRLRGMPDSSYHEARVFQILNDHGIKFGADHDAIRKIVHTVQTSTTPLHIEATVARGIPPTPGVDGQVRRLVRKADKVQIREDGKADFRNVKKFVTVEKGQPVVEIIPPQPGTAGHNLLGEEIKPDPPAPAPRKPGKNISLVPGGHEYIARLHGIYVDDGNIVDVNPELVINGNAGLETGHIEYDGNVRILGNIERGTQVKVGGNLSVGGTIESGQLKVVGDLAVNQGINTARNGTISCHGNIKATYIENSVLVCDGDVEVSRSILTSYLITHGSIRMATGGSTLAGSEIVCFGNLEVDILGSKVGGVTRIFAGTHYKNAKQWEQSKKELEEIEQRVEQLTYKLQQYRDKVQRYRGNVPVQLQAEIRTQFSDYKEELAKRKRATSIYNYLTAHRRNSEPIDIIGRTTIQAGVEIHYHGHTEKITAPLSATRLEFVPGIEKPSMKAATPG